ncbi:hypothetical protein T4A_3939 [Trichinella pseudospiralis]|uniref:Uncharacterized protein n=1 Tax=Trichinella pseudospiralis TaxID=6337 RepID=A0A0V1DSL2_TRIPS|nr:hypothetical protein T4A_3939 [Trichinella pseudospiralis]
MSVQITTIASKCEFPSHCCGDGETIRLLGQVIFGVNNDDKWHLEQASQLKHDDVGSHHRAALSAIGICSAKAPSSNTSTPQRQATNAAVQLTENDATHAGKLVNMAQYAERATMVIYVQFVFDRLRRLKSGRSMTPTL